MAGVEKILLDTSAYSAFNRGDARLQPWFKSSLEICTPLIVIGELRAGFAAGSRRAENEALLRRFLDAPNVSQLTLSATTTEHFAALYLKLRQGGVTVSTNDLWIAALSIEHNLAILSLDEDFSRIPGVRIVKFS